MAPILISDDYESDGYGSDISRDGAAGSVASSVDIETDDLMKPLKELELAGYKNDWRDLDQAYTEVRLLCQDLGFNIRKTRTTKFAGSSDVRNILIQCTRGGKTKAKKTYYRDKRSGTTECQWKAALSVSKKQEFNNIRFYFQKKFTHGSKNKELLDQHNHLLDPLLADQHPTNRRANITAEHKRFIEAHAHQPGYTSTSMALSLQEMHPGLQIKRSDVKNISMLHKATKYGARTDTQAFFEYLRSVDGIFTSVRRKDPANERSPAVSIFWMLPSMIERLQEHPDLLIFDSTYKTNKFDIPFFQGVGLTQYNTHFSVCFAFISKEHSDGFEWILRCLEQVFLQYKIRFPQAVVSDHDLAFKNAVSSVFGPGIQQLICRWHILKNVVWHIKKKWIGQLEGTSLGETGGGQGSRIKIDTEADLTDLEPSKLEEMIGNDTDSSKWASKELSRNDRISRGDTKNSHQSLHKSNDSYEDSANQELLFQDNADGLLQAFRACIYASDEHKFQEIWIQLTTQFSDQADLIRYLTKTWLPFVHQFCTFAVKNTRNFGICVSSGAESQHAAIKRHLKSSRSSLMDVNQAIDQMLKLQNNRYKDEQLKSKAYKLNSLWNRHYLRALWFQISTYAIQKVAEQGDLADKDAEDDRYTICSGSFSTQFGIPCKHKIRDALLDQRALKITDFDKHWWIDQDTKFDPREQAIFDEQDPEKVVNKRQKVKKRDFSTKCQPSHDALPSNIRKGFRPAARGCGKAPVHKHRTFDAAQASGDAVLMPSSQQGFQSYQTQPTQPHITTFNNPTSFNVQYYNALPMQASHNMAPSTAMSSTYIPSTYMPPSHNMAPSTAISSTYIPSTYMPPSTNTAQSTAISSTYIPPSIYNAPSMASTTLPPIQAYMARQGQHNVSRVQEVNNRWQNASMY